MSDEDVEDFIIKLSGQEITIRAGGYPAVQIFTESENGEKTCKCWHIEFAYALEKWLGRALKKMECSKKLF